MRSFIFVASAFALMAGTAHGNVLIEVGQISLLPNQPNQTVNFFLFSDLPDRTKGLSLDAQLGDGGPIEGTGGVDITPAMTGDATGPGMLMENNGTPFDGSVPPSFVNIGVINAHGPPDVPVGATLLFSLTFDTTGFGPGYSTTLKLTDTVNGDTQLPDLTQDLIIHNGSITIVPEPSTVVLAALGLVGLVVWGWRRRRA